MMKKKKKTENKVGQKIKTRRWGKRRKRREITIFIPNYMFTN